jgi:hypothetical protein
MKLAPEKETMPAKDTPSQNKKCNSFFVRNLAD